MRAYFVPELPCSLLSGSKALLRPVYALRLMFLGYLDVLDFRDGELVIFRNGYR